jgi:hypothetical protein
LGEIGHRLVTGFFLKIWIGYSNRREGKDNMDNESKAIHRAVNNQYFLNEIRRKLIARQPGNEVFAEIVANISPEDLLRHWMAQKPTRKPEAKAKPPVVTLI